MPGIILLMDDEQNSLDVWSELLEDEGYQVLRAETVKAAELLLQTHWIHLAVLDIQMEQQDRDDFSGLQMAKKLEYRLIPKIMLTAHGDNAMYVRDSLRRLEDGNPVAVEFVSKAEGHKPLLDAIRRVFDDQMKINWDQRFVENTGLPVTFPYLAGLIDTELAGQVLPERAKEIEDLLRMLFPTFTEVEMNHIVWHAGHQVGLQVVVYTPDREETFLVTLGERDTVRANRKGDELLTHRIADLAYPKILALRETLHYVAAAWKLSSDPQVAFEPLITMLPTATEKVRRQIFDNLITNFLKALYDGGRETKGTKDLLEFYQRATGFPGQGEETLLEALSTLAGKWKARGVLDDIEIRSDVIRFRFPWGRVFQLTNPIPYLVEKQDFPQIRLTFTQTLGGLSSNSILVDREGRPWLTDFSRTCIAPIWHDLITLENGLRFHQIEDINLQVAYDSEEKILLATDLGETVRLGEIEGYSGLSAQAILILRKHARKLCGDNPTAYHLGLMFDAADGLFQYPPVMALSKRGLTTLFYRLLFCALEVEKIFAIKRSDPVGQPAVSRILKIDTETHEAVLAEERIPLTNREYQLFLYLYENRSRVCQREEIVREVFGITESSQQDEEGLFYTNVNRLRKKIEPDPDHPSYIVTRWGNGIRLIEDP